MKSMNFDCCRMLPDAAGCCRMLPGLVTVSRFVLRDGAALISIWDVAELVGLVELAELVELVEAPMVG